MIEVKGMSVELEGADRQRLIFAGIRPKLSQPREAP